MKHLTKMSVPKMALGDGHPSLSASIIAFFNDPIGTLRLHLNK